jgi:uncharacterized damage-inducible protein DinB
MRRAPKPDEPEKDLLMATRGTPFLTPEAALAHWQGHRRLTRRVIEAFPDDQLFSHAVGGMRPFGALALELLSMAEPMARGLATGAWDSYAPAKAGTKKEVLALWDEATPRIDEQWGAIPAARFQERTTAFGQFEGPAYDLMLYVIDNEVHHRGQGYVYLRGLGVEPPHFWER